MDVWFQVAVVDLMVVVTLVTVAILLRRIFGATQFKWLAFCLPLLALVWGMAWKFWPTLVDARLLPLPRGQGAGIILLIALLLMPSMNATFRKELQSLNWLPLAGFSYWRAIYGAGLILLGLQGALPAGFFWSAGIGDIIAGLWGMSIAARLRSRDSMEFTVWNWFALADLVHVIAVGALTLRPFFLANPEVSPVTMLPLAGVPMLIALHAFAALALYRRPNLWRTPA